MVDRARGRGAALWVRALACAGLLGGHWLAYAAVRPDDHSRAHLLESTGHGYWGVAVTVAVAVGAAALVGQVAAALQGSAEQRTLTRTTRMLALPQAAGFVVLELVERAVSGGHGGRLLALLLAVGIVFQVVVAAALAALAAALVSTVVRLVKGARPRVRRRSAPPLPRLRRVFLPRARVLSGPRATRGPPALLPA